MLGHLYLCSKTDLLNHFLVCIPSWQQVFLSHKAWAGYQDMGKPQCSLSRDSLMFAIGFYLFLTLIFKHRQGWPENSLCYWGWIGIPNPPASLLGCYDGMCALPRKVNSLFPKLIMWSTTPTLWYIN